MVFAGGAARAPFDEDATPCAPSVLSANQKLGALWLGSCIIAESLIAQSGQVVAFLGSYLSIACKVGLSKFPPDDRLINR